MKNREGFCFALLNFANLDIDSTCKIVFGKILFNDLWSKIFFFDGVV